ncbi:MAG TPA: M1 family aminopeptidase [Candidatus Acidoferrum sp.]|nr:M1 family aminopeptidase [Candidatus Acidoferrum sp.]
MLYRTKFSPRAFALLLSALALAVSSPLRAQEPPQRPVGFLADNYDVSATLDSNRQSISAVAKVQFRATEVTANLRVELHPNLIVSDVKLADGKSIGFGRDSMNPLYVLVTLPTPVAAGDHVTLTFTYSGLLANAENSPIPGITAAAINHDNAYLLLPARWFPLTNYPSNRYTATFHLNVPDTFAVAGSGTANAPTPLPGGRLLYTFDCKDPAPHGTFVAGNLQLNPKQSEGMNIAVYAPRSDSANAQAFADDVSHAITVFSDIFGGLKSPDMTLIQLPDGTLRDFSAPGVLLLSHRIWEPKSAERTIARLVAGQWFGDSILPASPGDVWISDGLARYCEELYAEQSAGREAGLRAVDEFAVGALMYDDAAPVSQAARLAPYSGDYRSVVMNKGAMIFHMLRGLMGDVAFRNLLHDFATTYAGKTARIEDLVNLADRDVQAAAKPGQVAPNLRPFFSQWLNSTGVPEFSVEYVVYRTPKGFRIVGKIKQPIDTFSMPIQIRVDTEGNPETKWIDVLGTESPFTIETFGRPKPNGIKIDPNNLVLKGSVSLRARAAIARGEEVAEQGLYYDAIKQYQRALSIQPGQPLANFRMGEAFFYQRNYQASANSFRECLQAVPDPSEKWTEVWAHIYLGKIFDVLGQRERAVNEYSKARQTNDNTGGAQAQAQALLKKPFSESGVSASTPGGAAAPAATPAQPAGDTRPTLKKRTDPNGNPLL